MYILYLWNSQATNGCFLSQNKSNWKEREEFKKYYDNNVRNLSCYKKIIFEWQEKLFTPTPKNWAKKKLL